MFLNKSIITSLHVTFITHRIVIALVFHLISTFITFMIILISILISISSIAGNCRLIGFLLTFLNFQPIFVTSFSFIATISVFVTAELMFMNNFD